MSTIIKKISVTLIFFTFLLFLKIKFFKNEVADESIKRTPSSVSAEVFFDDVFKIAIKEKKLLISSDDTVAQKTAYDHQDYFLKTLKTNPQVKNLYDKSINILGQSEEASLVSEYVAESLVRRETQEFSQYYQELLTDLNNHNQGVYSLLVKNEERLKKDKVIYQNILNLSFQMSLPEVQKLRLLGGGVLSKFEFDKVGSISFESTNITNAMILLKNANLSKKEVYKYLMRGLMINNDDVRSKREYVMRANSYFPEMVDVF